MRSSTLLTATVLLVTAASAQVGWFWQNPLPQGNVINDSPLSRAKWRTRSATPEPC